MKIISPTYTIAVITTILLLSSRETILRFLIPSYKKTSKIDIIIKRSFFNSTQISVYRTVPQKILGKILKEKSWRVTLHAIWSYLIDVLEQLDCTDCIRKGVVPAPINLRSLESRFPVRGCGQTVDLSANKRTKKSTEKEERKEKRRGEKGREGKKKKKECRTRASQPVCASDRVRFTFETRNSCCSRNRGKTEIVKKSTKRIDGNERNKGMTERFIEFQRTISPVRFLPNSKGVKRVCRGLDINDSWRSWR